MISDIVDLNGSTEYLEIYAVQGSGTSLTLDGARVATWFAGVLL